MSRIGSATQTPVKTTQAAGTILVTDTRVVERVMASLQGLCTPRTVMVRIARSHSYPTATRDGRSIRSLGVCSKLQMSVKVLKAGLSETTMPSNSTFQEHRHA